ncbi:hypothetical protein BDM02DRAFT_3131908, partial [Thelephora ganbajun]
MKTTGPPPDPDDVNSGSDTDDRDDDEQDSDGGSEAGDEDGDSNGEDGGLEDLLPDSTDEPLDSFRDKAEEWLEIDGQRYHKVSLIAQRLKANQSKKVIERTLHATAIHKERSTQRIISMETLTSRDSEYRVEGQVLRLVQARPDLWAWLPHHFLKVSKPKKGPACDKT